MADNTREEPEVLEQPSNGEKEIEGDDPITKREELELELMDEGESEKGADIGEHID